MRTSVIRWIGAYRKGVHTLASSLEWELCQTTKQVCAELIIFPEVEGPAVPWRSPARVGLFVDERDVLAVYESDCWSRNYSGIEFEDKHGDILDATSSLLFSDHDPMVWLTKVSREHRRNMVAKARKELRKVYRSQMEMGISVYSEVFLARGWKATGIAIAANTKAEELEEMLPEIWEISRAYNLPVYKGISGERRTRANNRRVKWHKFVRVEI